MRRIAIIIISVLVLIGIDVLSKNYIGFLTTGNYVPLLGQYIGFELSYNPWIAFSLPLKGILLQIVTILVIVSIMWYYIKYEFQKSIFLLDFGYICIFSWALSHAYERIFIGYVIDFISVKYFAILNFADIFITIGACLLFFVYYVRKQ